MNFAVPKEAFEKEAVIHVENNFKKQLLGVQITSENIMINNIIKQLWSTCNSATKKIFFVKCKYNNLLCFPMGK